MRQLLTQGFADDGASRPLRPVTQEVANGHREVVVWVHESDRRRDDAVAVGVGIIAESDVESVLEAYQAGHGVRTRAVHANLSVMIHRHERERRIDSRIDDRDFETVTLGKRSPICRGGAAERIDADFTPAERMASRSITFARSCT